MARRPARSAGGRRADRGGDGPLGSAAALQVRGGVLESFLLDAPRLPSPPGGPVDRPPGAAGDPAGPPFVVPVGPPPGVGAPVPAPGGSAAPPGAAGERTAPAQPPTGAAVAPRGAATQPAPGVPVPPAPVAPAQPAPAPVAPAPPAPAPPAPAPAVAPAQGTPPAIPYFADCAAVREAGAAPLLATDPGYRPELDPDGDGTACP